MTRTGNTSPENAHIYLTGSGIAALASAVLLIRDAGVPGGNIHILEKARVAGGALDGSGDAEKGFVTRGGRMHERHYTCYWDLLSGIPSLENPDVSVTDETFEFNERLIAHGQARLLRAGRRLDVSSYGLSLMQQGRLLKLIYESEASLGDRRIEEWFDGAFFETNFWLIWSTMFAFQRWSSLAEMRRYMRRFIHMVEGLPRLGGILRTKYEQYHSVVVPLQRWLENKGVEFRFGVEVVDIGFEIAGGRKRATVLELAEGGSLPLGVNDYVFTTLGSITESSDNGAWDRVPVLKGLAESGAWKLWKKIAAKDPAFGNPSVFCDHIDGSKWYSFTATLKDPVFHDYMEEFSGNLSGTGGLVTLTDSNWLMSFVIARQPHFPNQPRDVKIFWGYGLYPDRKGNFVDKTMAECTGKEILDELWGHLKIQDLMKPFVDEGKVNCIPVAMPFVDALFMTRKIGDRPDVLPEGTENFAFLGQFVEAPHDCVFTVEYSVRTAQMAVYGLFDTGKAVSPVYDSIHNPKYLIEAARAISR
ncbi:oleate hydratase [Acetobacter oeni]|uniref:Oleate hydratase n=1 Tax=Acetobacter oeni TaxID=304077 RepID=A0A511XH21_9PROT|nr:oleate hydratase [Acetobacter oeni]MBB3882398.1 oleate hydratase [Acetobacter oeni]NHO18503.1 oleate hydratase [Acetobacter oeni]GBR09400.1 myosin-crossreactive antigen [Acetobacter oeni LMG 21952]GEN62256.1 oleate hydratase [Acetobacter oeni]